jgi:alpha-L-rhamnosidase
METRFLPFLFALCALLSGANRASSALEVRDPRCEHLSNPLGLDAAAPRFSWKLAADADPASRGQRQTAFHIAVASSPEKLAAGDADIWDSGFVASDRSQLVPFGGVAEKLVPNGDYYWRVRVRDRDGRESAWSGIARFSIGPRSREDWKGEWIKHPSAPVERHVWFRKKLTLDDAPATAFAHIASLGYHELYINGKKADARVLAPAISRPDRRVFYVTYDIAPLLKSGENLVALWHGPGWTVYRDNIGVINPAVIAQIDGKTKRGAAFTLNTDSSWKSAESNSRHIGKIPTRMGDMGGEEVDGRAANPAWNAPAFDDSAWPAAAVTQPLKNKKSWPVLSAHDTNPSRVAARLRPVKISPDGPGAWLVDFGVNFTGFLEARFHGLNSGDTVTLSISDRTESREMFSQRQLYLARGEAGEAFSNRFNYFNGRYLRIAGLKAQPAPEDIAGLVVTSAAPRSGSFVSSSELFNRIYETDLRTYEMCNTEGVTVDCPDRERLGYGAESAYMTAWGAGLPSFDSAAFYKKNIRDWSDVQSNNGKLPNTAPQICDGAWGGPLSSSAVFNLAWEYYLAHGDKTVLETAFDTEKKWLGFVYKKVDKSGVPVPGAGAMKSGHNGFYLGDWLAPSFKNGHRQEMGGELPYYFNTCVIALDLVLFGKTAAVLGHAEETALCGTRLAALRKAMHAKFYKGGGVYLNGDQVRTTFALHTGIVPDAEVEKTLAHLERDLTGPKPYFDIGSFGRYPFFKTLFEGGRFQETLAAILSRTAYPSYGNFLGKGETTWPECWEVRNDGCARAHTSYTGISGWFIKCLAGIEPSEEGPGYRVFTLRPRVVKDIRHAAATLESPFGAIKSAWRKSDDNSAITYEITVPVGAAALLTLPVNAARVTERGVPLAAVSGVKVVAEGESVSLRLESGAYRFETR